MHHLWKLAKLGFVGVSAVGAAHFASQTDYVKQAAASDPASILPTAVPYAAGAVAAIALGFIAL